MVRIIYNTDDADKTEMEILDYLNNDLYKDNKLKANKHFDLFDFENEKTKVELKTRSCNHNSYPTTMMNMSKINYAVKNKEKYKFIFYFLFKDGLYKWDFKEDNYKIEIGGRFDRGDANDRKLYSYIPVNDLILVDELCKSTLEARKRKKKDTK
tara:strand:+ start:1742 stop:2203 length:462 start_codon:yes stop_codon:yes gene_type:complete